MKRNKTLILLLTTLYLLFPAVISAQAPETLWTKTYGGTNDDVGRSMQLTTDGGCIIAGYTQSFGAGGSDVWLIKTDSLGDTLWTRTYGGSLDDEAYSIQVATGNGYIIAGMTKSFGAGGADVWLIKTSANGNTEWMHTFGDSLDDVGYSVQKTFDGGYIIVGDKCLIANFSTAVYLIKVDTLGNTLWTRTYRPESIDVSPRGWARAIQQTFDGGYIIAAAGFNGYPDLDFEWLIRTDSVGDTLWTRRGEYDTYWEDIKLRPDRGFIITGACGMSHSPFWIATRDSLGYWLWGGAYGDGTGHSIQSISNLGYIVTGDNYRGSSNLSDVFLVRISPFGDTLWTKNVGDSLDDVGYSVQLTTEGDFLVAGFTKSFGNGGTDVYLIKTEPEVGIEERSTPNAQCVSPNAAIVRGVLMLSTSDKSRVTSQLLDISGRKMIDLHMGANDMRHLASGVYFIRSKNNNQVTKIIVTK